ncbi:hypothetical protein ACFO4O_08550 [Glaciecola siphonariae]|uniref:Uncharacterized protein n=1 Tax=Glaciecola siphonariae TaxID=521012 RepID=A0ABV9LUK7_9ALTE
MGKIVAEDTATDASNDALSDIEQLRLIVFGQAKQELDQKIRLLDKRMSDELNSLQLKSDERHAALLETINENHASLLNKLDEIDGQHDSNAAALDADIKQLNAQLEMAENASRDDSLALHKRIDSEVDDLQSQLKSAINDLSEQLNAMNNNLASSKTDRKILAKLLANVATNLEIDD